MVIVAVYSATGSRPMITAV